MKAMMGLLMALGLALGGCGNNDCEDAADKIKECNIAEFDVNPNSGGDCSGQSECAAKCINDATCADLASNDENSKFSVCFKKCLGG